MGKKYNAAKEKLELQSYSIDEAFRLAPETAVAKFNESIDIAARLGIDPRHPDQMVRGTVVLPHGTGKKVRVLVFAKGEKEIEARDAGAEHVGSDDLFEKIKKGWLEFDSAVATPDMMGTVGKLGKILGPRGLMPNPKLGTVTFDVKRAVTELKAGKVEYRSDKAGNIHVCLGKVGFGPEKLRENFKTLMEALMKAKPTTSKGSYLRGLSISTTMGPAIHMDLTEVRNMFK